MDFVRQNVASYSFSTKGGFLIGIYTEQFTFWGKVKFYIKYLLGRHHSGPFAVYQSLVRGLKEIRQPFCVNKPFKILNGGVVVVLSGKSVLERAIKAKQQGLINKLIAGPNIVVVPTEAGSIVQDPAVDAFLVPSQWSKDWWTSIAPSFGDRLVIWPAGVEVCSLVARPYSGHVVIYQKNGPESLVDTITTELKKEGVNFKLLKYGSHSHGDYFKLLNGARLLVVVSNSESQGLAMQEAWMAGVPTLVWRGEGLVYKGYEWRDETMAAPFLVDTAGLFFKGGEDFSRVFKSFVQTEKSFAPRSYVLQNLTDVMCAQKLMIIIKHISMENQKVVKFAPHLVPLVLSGKKTSTWRLFDDKNLSAGDDVVFQNKETGEQFAHARITVVKEKKLGEITEADYVGHERFDSIEDMYKAYKTYYGEDVTPDTIVKMVSFELI